METQIPVYDMGKIYEMLDHIRRRPNQLLTTKSISALQNLLNGYLLVNHRDSIYFPGEPDFDEFISLILNRGNSYRFGKGNPFSSTFLIECLGDEERAFDKFFELLDEFKRGLHHM